MLGQIIVINPLEYILNNWFDNMCDVLNYKQKTQRLSNDIYIMLKLYTVGDCFDQKGTMFRYM